VTEVETGVVKEMRWERGGGMRRERGEGRRHEERGRRGEMEEACQRRGGTRREGGGRERRGGRKRAPGRKKAGMGKEEGRREERDEGGARTCPGQQCTRIEYVSLQIILEASIKAKIVLEEVEGHKGNREVETGVVKGVSYEMI
jgi:hypothetical protein